MVVDSDGSSLGRMKYEAAQSIALDQGLDLVQVSKNEDISVFKIMDRGKWQYQQSKTQKKNKAHQTKEVKFRICTAQHDIETKLNHIKKFLSKGHPVKILVEMRGRERGNPQVAQEKLQEIIEHLNGTRSDDIKSTRSSVSISVHPTSGK